jgi:hypothetical protein
MKKNETNVKRKRGGQQGNQNALKHGFYTRGTKGCHEQANALIMNCHQLLNRLSSGDLDNVRGLISISSPQLEDGNTGVAIPLDDS